MAEEDKSVENSCSECSKKDNESEHNLVITITDPRESMHLEELEHGSVNIQQARLH